MADECSVVFISVVGVTASPMPEPSNLNCGLQRRGASLQLFF